VINRDIYGHVKQVLELYMIRYSAIMDSSRLFVAVALVIIHFRVCVH